MSKIKDNLITQLEDQHREQISELDYKLSKDYVCPKCYDTLEIERDEWVGTDTNYQELVSCDCVDDYEPIERPM